MFDAKHIRLPRSALEVSEFDWQHFASHFQASRQPYSVLDDCTHVTGRYVAKDAHIFGRVKGLVFAETVTVEKSGMISGVIFCRSLAIAGDVNANIICDDAKVRAGGRLMATLKYRTLQVALGAFVSGTFEVR